MKKAILPIIKNLEKTQICVFSCAKCFMVISGEFIVGAVTFI